jgi:hypothetical protein
MWYSEQQLTEIIKVVSVAIETYNHNRQQRQIKQQHFKNATPPPQQCNSNET